MRRRAAFTIVDVIMFFVTIIVLVQLYPTLLEYTSQAASQASGVAAVFWNMIPWMLPLALIATLWKKAQTPSVQYEE